MSIEYLSETRAEAQLKELFDKCVTDNLFDIYSLDLASTHPIKEAPASYMAHYQLVVQKRTISEEVRRRVIMFIRQNDCEWSYLGHTRLIQDLKASLLSLSVKITPTQEPII